VAIDYGRLEIYLVIRKGKGMKCPKCETVNPDDSKFCKECATSLTGGEDAQPSFTKTLETPVETITKGTIFAGRYEILGLLGKGGMGKVFKAYDKEVKEEVAVKLIKPEIAQDETTIERFRNELKIARKVSHRNVCRMHDLGKAEEGYYISMEYVEGEDLKSYIRRIGKLTEADVINIAQQVCDGLKEAHELGVIHRDMKPQNIMIDKNGRMKIMDFGIARSVEAAGVTQTGVMIGTPDYISPEQAEGETADQRSDIYSFGVILYEMVTGSVPFKGDTAFSVALKHKSKLPQDPRKLNPEISDNLSRLILICMEKDRERRYQSAEEILNDLHNIEEGLPLGTKIQSRRRTFITALMRKKFFLPALIVALSVLLIFVGRQIFFESPITIDSIAVLPLENLSGDPSQEYFSNGITDALINELAKLSALRVISRQSVMQYKESHKPLSEIAKELNVDAVVEASVLKVGDKIQIRARLIQAPNEQNLWAQSYEREMTDILALQSEMAQTIAQEVKVNLTPSEKKRLTINRSVNPVAYEAYLKGQFHLYKLTSIDLETALQYFELALENDPDSALAYSGIAKVWLGRMAMGLAPTNEAGPRAKAAAMKALEIDSNQAEVHFALAWVAWLDWDWAAAWAAYRQAIALNPNSASARVYYSNFLYVMGNPEEAMHQIELALDLDPFNPLFQAIYAMGLMYARRYDEVIELLRNTLKTAPNDPVALSTLRSAYHQKQMFEEALEIWQTSYTAKGDLEATEALALGNSESGYSGALSRVAEMLIMRSRNTSEYVTPWQIGTLYTRAGKIDEALEWLEKACDEKDSNMPYINVDPIFDILRDEPRFQDLLRRLNFPDKE
jgi:serine/threonine protein kinase/Flp pilus assembly protein TadD